MELGDTGQAQRERGTFDFALQPAQPDRAEAARRALDFSDRPPRVKPKTSVLEWIGLVLAVIAPPLGLVVTIVARIVTRYRNHWTTTVAKAAMATPMERMFRGSVRNSTQFMTRP